MRKKNEIFTPNARKIASMVALVEIKVKRRMMCANVKQ